MFGLRISRHGYLGLLRPVRAFARGGPPVRTWVSKDAYYHGFKDFADPWVAPSRPTTAEIHRFGAPISTVQKGHTISFDGAAPQRIESVRPLAEGGVLVSLEPVAAA